MSENPVETLEEYRELTKQRIDACCAEGIAQLLECDQEAIAVIEVLELINTIFDGFGIFIDTIFDDFQAIEKDRMAAINILEYTNNFLIVKLRDSRRGKLDR